MTGYEMVGTPFAIASIISLAPGELDKQEKLYTIPDGRMLIVEYVGINSFLQEGQELLSSIMPVFDSGLTVYPINLIGTSLSPNNTAMPFRRFGSQKMLLYANDRVDIFAGRSSAEGNAHIEFNISGRLIEPVQQMEPPGNLRIDE